MSSQKIHRVGLVGAGYISKYHLAALDAVPNARVVGIVDLDLDRAKKLAQEHDVPASTDLKALAEAGATVIHVLTPPATHVAVAQQALELGCHVLIEKPLAEDVADCDVVVAAARDRRLSACVNHSLLFDPHVVRARALVAEGKLGKLVSVDILRGSEYPPYSGGRLPPHYRDAGYPFRDLGVHALYLLQAFLGPIEHVDGSWASLGGDPLLVFDEWRAVVRCRNGLGQFQLSWNAKPMQSQIILHGTQGVLRLDLFSMFQARRNKTKLPKAAERIVNALTDSIEPLIEMPQSIVKFASGKIKSYQGLRDLVAAFYRALDDDGPMPVTLEEATTVVRWTEHVARAAEKEHRERKRANGAASKKAEVLVTGAAGALGTAIVERLCERGVPLRCFVRRRGVAFSPVVDVVVGDLGDPDAVDRAVCGVKRVIHVGAAMKGAWVDHECGTIMGTQNVLQSCAKHAVHKLVHISSMSVIDFAGGEDGSVINEDTLIEPRPDERGFYTRAKLEAEKRVLEHARQGVTESVILRPGQIFGGRIPLLTGAVARRVGGRWLVLGDGEIVLPLVYIDDVVDAVIAALDGDFGGGEIVQVIDHEALTQNQVLALALDGAKVVHIPRELVFLGGRLSEPLLKAAGRSSPIAEYRLRSALAKRRFHSKNAERLGWTPRVGVREGIARVLAGQG